MGLAYGSIASRHTKDEIAVRFFAREIELDKRSAKARDALVSVIVESSRLIFANRAASGKISNTLKVLRGLCCNFAVKDK